MTIFDCKTENLPDKPIYATITTLDHSFAAIIFALGSLSSVDGQEVGVVIYGSHGDRPGEFNDPAGIVVDPNGYLFVVDSHNNRIQKFTNNGSFVTEWGTSGNKNGQLSSPNRD
jgi:DNA-binding beta-propeller fold protein YncE